MSEKLIIQKSSQPLNLNESKTEKPKALNYVLGGIFTEFDVVNENGRIYTEDAFLPHIEKLKKDLPIYGEYDHPQDFSTSMKNVSHMVESLDYDRQKKAITGSIRLANNFWGREAKALAEDGCPIYVSSRAAGTTGPDGKVIVKELFTYDIVATPGFSNARMKQFESVALNENYSPERRKRGEQRYYKYKLAEARRNYALSHNENANLQLVEDANVLIYEVNESDTNNLVNTVGELKSKESLSDFSYYITNQVADVKLEMQKITEKIDVSEEDKKRLLKLAERYDQLKEQQEKMNEYLEYFFKLEKERYEDLQAKNEEIEHKLKEYKVDVRKTRRLAKKSEEGLKEVRDYNEHLHEHLKTRGNHTDKEIIPAINALIENQSKIIKDSKKKTRAINASIDYTERAFKTADRHFNKLHEKVNDIGAYSNYLAEKQDQTMDYVDQSSKFWDRHASYTDYLAKSTDNLAQYTEGIAEGKGLKESKNGKKENFGQYNRRKLNEEARKKNRRRNGIGGLSPAKKKAKALNESSNAKRKAAKRKNMKRNMLKENRAVKNKKTVKALNKKREVQAGDYIGLHGHPSYGKVTKVIGENVQYFDIDTQLYETVQKDLVYLIERKENNVKNVINNLFEELEKQKVVNEENPDFYMFLEDEEIKSFKNLTENQQHRIRLSWENKEQFPSRELIMRIINEALQKEQKPLEERLIDNMPNNVRKIWKKLSKADQMRFLGEAKFYKVDTEEEIKYFWEGRNFESTDLIQRLNESKRRNSRMKGGELVAGNDFNNIMNEEDHVLASYEKAFRYVNGKE